MAEPTEMKPKDAPAGTTVQREVTQLVPLCPCCGKPFNPLLRMFETPIKGTHLVVYCCSACRVTISCSLEPTNLIAPSGLIGPSGVPI
jgi:hypothetical protein